MSDGTGEMLTSLLELQKSITEQIELSQRKLEGSTSESEKGDLEKKIHQLDNQLSEAKSDFERIATGVESALFAEKKPEIFSWKDELASLLEPAIKELKRFTIRARKKTDLKDEIVELELLTATATQAVTHLQQMVDETADNRVQKQIKALQPEWVNIEKRLQKKLELTRSELQQLEGQEVSLVETSQKSLRSFFKNRGLYLMVAALTFLAVLLVFRVLYRLVVALSVRFTGQQEERSLQIRLLYLIFQVLSVVFAIVGLFFVLYLAEDWFLLSMAIIFFLGLAWTIRQALPRLWQQARLMLNVGSVRENERLILHGVPWKVASINVFCTLVNPSLDVELRVPIENLIGMVSRPWHPEEPWFPCKKGDWVVVGDASRAKVVSLSHEQVEVIERGGKRIFYPTQTFLEASPANLSRNFRVRVIFGLSYSLQSEITQEIPDMLQKYITSRMEEEGYQNKCLNLRVEFMQANASSLDLIILADFSGSLADISKRLERSIQKWCVEFCTINNWEIPFPQLTVHGLAGE
jgi:small-conductance mechanosensitive channel